MSTILRYVFATGEAIEMEVEDEYAAVVLKDRKDEGNQTGMNADIRYRWTSLHMRNGDFSEMKIRRKPS